MLGLFAIFRWVIAVSLFLLFFFLLFCYVNFFATFGFYVALPNPSVDARPCSTRRRRGSPTCTLNSPPGDVHRYRPHVSMPRRATDLEIVRAQALPPRMCPPCAFLPRLRPSRARPHLPLVDLARACHGGALWRPPPLVRHSSAATMFCQLQTRLEQPMEAGPGQWQ
jgi:hypothetical protein